MMLLVSQALLWLIVILLAVAVIALARQIGVLHERIAPAGALAMGQGPQPGDASPQIEVRALDGSRHIVGAKGEGDALRLLVFLAPTCPICKQIMPAVDSFARRETLDLLYIGDGDAVELRAMALAFGISEDRFINDSHIGRAYHVGKLPYAVLLKADGTIVAQGLINSREHLESLLNVNTTGFTSVQEYLRARKSAN